MDFRRGHTASFNPLSLIAVWRREDFLRSYANAGAVLLLGTQDYKQVAVFIISLLGTAHVQSTCCDLALFNIEFVHSIAFPAVARRQGRALAVRYRRGERSARYPVADLGCYRLHCPDRDY